MKQLVIFRHGKTEEHHPSGDFFRELVPRGILQVPLMGEKLNKTGFVPDAIFTSPAARAMQTAILLAKTIHYDEHKIIIDKNLYTCPAPDLLDFVKNIPEHFSSVIVVGHNEGLTDFVKLYSDIKIDNLPTSGFALLSHNGQSWKESAEKFMFNGTVDYPSLNSN